MANQPYNSTWIGAMPQNTTPVPPQNQNTQMMQSSPPPQEQMNPWAWQMGPMPQNNISNLFIAPVSSQDVVDNYIVARGVTAFLINYAEGIFWVKRLKDDGLGYEITKHRFCTEEEWNTRMNPPSVPSNGVSMEDFEKLQKDIAKLRVDFDEFIK